MFVLHPLGDDLDQRPQHAGILGQAILVAGLGLAVLIDRGLRAENHGVTVAPTGSEGVELAKTGEFDVIVLDLMLPDMHGYDVCQRIRLEGDHTPILMLTAMDATEDKIKGLKAGADDYLTKPFDFDELLARIRALAIPPAWEDV